MVDFHGLFKGYLQGFKEIGGSQAVALCHNHDDTKQSLSIHFGKGLCNCFACGYKANAYQFAVDVGHPNPKEYIVDMNGDVVAPEPKSSKPPVPPPNLKKLMEQFKQHLKDNTEQFPLSYVRLLQKGTQDLIDVCDIGLDDRKNLVFGHHNEKGELIGIKIHKKNTIGNGKNKLYLKHLLGSYDHDIPLYIFVKGEKDAIVLYSYGYQAVSGTCGAISVPKDENGDNEVDFIEFWNAPIVFVYDNDSAGYKGADKWAIALKSKWVGHTIKIAQWDKKLPEKYDVFDAFHKAGEDIGADLWDAVANAEEIKLPAPSFGGLKFKSGVDILKSETAPTFELIEAFLPQHQQILIAGTKKANKSTMCMQMGMALANNEKQFLGFNINATDVEVLYIDLEVGEPQFDYRYKKLATTFNNFENNGAKRFNRVCKVASEPNLLQEIENAIQYYRPDVVFFDCFYKITGGVDVSKAHNLYPYTTALEEMKFKFNLTIPIVHHLLKGNHELGLQDDRMAGSSELGFWMEHCVLISKTNEPFMRMLTWGDSRSIATPDQYYGLDFDPKNYSLTNRGLIDWEKYLLTKKKKKEYEYYLSFMDDEFTTDEWHKKTWDDEVPISTSEKWLSHMKKCKMIERPKKCRYGKWKKKLTEIVDVTER